WIDDHSFWYSTIENGYTLVDAAKGTKKQDSDLSKLTGNVNKTEAKNSFRDNTISPDGKWKAYINNYNLWVKNTASGDKKQLTTDGEKDYGYATDNAGWTHSENAIVRWSPDSKKIATFKQDERNVGEMYLVSTNVGHPKLEQWKYPLPGDSVVAMIDRVIINVDVPKVIKLQMAPDFHRGTLSDDISSSGTLDDVDWTADGKELALISTSRDHKHETVRIANAETGDVRTVFEETVATQYESGQGAINFKYLPSTNEIIWYSERSDYGHLYLYNSLTGKLKNQISKGNIVVTKILNVDDKKREIIFEATGADKKNPYFKHYFIVKLDGSGQRDLTPETGDHRIAMSPENNYFINTFSQPDVPQEINVRSVNGKMVTPLQKADISKLLATGWKAPEPITLKAADGKIAIYGLLFTPSKMEAGKKYPIIDYIYPGPQGGSVGSWSFSAARGDNQGLAELGFVIVQIEGTSNPLRSKSFHDMAYGNMAENTLPDQVSGIRQLATKYNFIDTSRIGIWGHSGGGFATADAMFSFPDFFKVGISESGNHDNRNYEDDWGERYNGLANDAAGKEMYRLQANQENAKNLKGHLMLAHGMMDDNVPPGNTMLVVETLEKANKDFDLVIFPNQHHGYGPFGTYMMRRRWDYFVKYLMGVEGPKEFEFYKGK
ncbi:MAG: DPP IV N-terminal domain-containing protein, partial [Ferruginibacter sp.]